jgi:hypothetical protein
MSHYDRCHPQMLEFSLDAASEAPPGVECPVASIEYPVDGAYPRADRVLLAELALLGQFSELPEELFFRRMHPAGSTFANTNAGERRFWNPSRRGEVFTLPRWQVALEHLRAVQHAPLTSAERRSAHAAVLRHYGFTDRDVLVNDLKSIVYRIGAAVR